MPQAKIGVIGGSGLYDIEGMTGIEEVDLWSLLDFLTAVDAESW